MNINCPDCKYKLGENETGIIDVKSKVRVVFEANGHLVAFTCPRCSFVGQYDATGGVWVINVTEVL